MTNANGTNNIKSNLVHQKSMFSKKPALTNADWLSIYNYKPFVVTENTNKFVKINYEKIISIYQFFSQNKEAVAWLLGLWEADGYGTFQGSAQDRVFLIRLGFRLAADDELTLHKIKKLFNLNNKVEHSKAATFKEKSGKIYNCMPQIIVRINRKPWIWAFIHWSYVFFDGPLLAHRHYAFITALAHLESHTSSMAAFRKRTPSYSEQLIIYKHHKVLSRDWAKIAINPYFPYWFVGFTVGEGTFGVYPFGRHSAKYFTFSIAQRGVSGFAVLSIICVFFSWNLNRVKQLQANFPEDAITWRLVVNGKKEILEVYHFFSQHEKYITGKKNVQWTNWKIAVEKYYII